MSWSKVCKARKVKVQEEGEISEGMDDTETQTIWKKTMVVLSKGALWGDVECYSPKDIDVKKRVVAEKVIVKPFNCDNCLEDCEVIMKKKNHGMVCLKCFDSIQTPEPLKKCKGCHFHVHSSPPADFTLEQRSYCCSICQTSKGRKHGGRCEQGAC
jgi:hypothetical protein